MDYPAAPQSERFAMVRGALRAYAWALVVVCAMTKGSLLFIEWLGGATGAMPSVQASLTLTVLLFAISLVVWVMVLFIARDGVYSFAVGYAAITYAAAVLVPFAVVDILFRLYWAWSCLGTFDAAPCRATNVVQITHIAMSFALIVMAVIVTVNAAAGIHAAAAEAYVSDRLDAVDAVMDYEELEIAGRSRRRKTGSRV